MWLCIDRRTLNKLTTRHEHPLLILTNLFDRSHGVKYLLKLDVRLEDFQVRMTEVKEPERTCVKRHGAFEFLVVPFGLTNALTTLRILMNQVFQEYLDNFVVVYIDNMVTYKL